MPPATRAPAIAPHSSRPSAYPARRPASNARERRGVMARRQAPKLSRSNMADEHGDHRRDDRVSELGLQGHQRPRSTRGRRRRRSARPSSRPSCGSATPRQGRYGSRSGVPCSQPLRVSRRRRSRAGSRRPARPAPFPGGRTGPGSEVSTPLLGGGVVDGADAVRGDRRDVQRRRRAAAQRGCRAVSRGRRAISRARISRRRCHARPPGPSVGDPAGRTRSAARRGRSLPPGRRNRPA